jgi:hypothetical protein
MHVSSYSHVSLYYSPLFIAGTSRGILIHVLWRSRDFIVGIVVFRYFLVPRMDLGVDDVIIKSKGKRFGKEKLFFLQEELRITKVCTKKPTSESALRAYDPTISILSSNELRFKIRRCRVDEARHSTIELT